MKIYRNAQGACVNIGEWDFQVAIVDGVEKIQNPLPQDVAESDEEVVIGWDGGLYAHDDPRRMK